MDQPITAAEANRAFEELLREVREQRRSFLVTAEGKPVARIVPVEDEDAARQAAWEELVARLKAQPAVNAGPWTREELYER